MNQLTPQSDLIVQKGKENWQKWQLLKIPNRISRKRDLSVLFVNMGLAACQVTNVAVANVLMACSICLHSRLW